MNLRKLLYFILMEIRGYHLKKYYDRFVSEEQHGIPRDTTHRLLVNLLTHCKQNVPYYAKVMRNLGDSIEQNPVEYLKRLPILTKEIIRNRFEELNSNDLRQRRWYYNTSGGSTGEPVRFIQDSDFAARMAAIAFLHMKLAGRDIGDREARLWGSERDISHGSKRWKARLANLITNTRFLNAYKMTPERMQSFVSYLNKDRPKLIFAYADSIYHLAVFCERESIQVKPQRSIITSATTLHPFMRDKIETLFQCPVFNFYGSREVGDVAAERPGFNGLWVAPWGNYVEVVNNRGQLVSNGTQGDLLVTSLSNYAMPLIRYRIGDCGALMPQTNKKNVPYGQVLKEVLGRTQDLFRAKDGTIIDPGYFESMLYYKDWIVRFQIIQKGFSHIVFRIIKSQAVYNLAELEEIIAKTRLIMGEGCRVDFDFVEEISSSGSGKFHYQISEIPPNTAVRA